MIKKHCDSILQLLMSVPTSGPPPDLLMQYDKLRRSHFPIMTRLSGLISHLGRKRISNHDLEILIHNAKDKAIKLHPSAMTKRVSPSAGIPASEEKVVDLADNSIPSQDPIQPPVKPKSSLKPGKFDPVIILETPPRNKDSTSPGQDDDEDDYGIYSKTIDGVGDGTHLITASFIKTNDKIRDQLLKNFNYFSELLCTNIDGLKIHPISSNKPLPILTSTKDKNMPTTGTKIRDYFFIQNQFSLNPGTRNKPKNPPQKVDSDGRFQFDEKRQFDGPDRITGIMSISAPGNIKDAINNLLIELEGDAHQICYKLTQQKNSKAEKMFPSIPVGLCPKGIMRSIQHGLKNVRRHCALLKSL